jgi:hypothetical protein
MEVLEITELEEGGAIIKLEITEEENDLLIGYAVRNILKESIEELESADNT